MTKRTYFDVMDKVQHTSHNAMMYMSELFFVPLSYSPYADTCKLQIGWLNDCALI